LHLVGDLFELNPKIHVMYVGNKEIYCSSLRHAAYCSLRHAAYCILRHAAYCSLRHAAYCSLRHAAYCILRHAAYCSLRHAAYCSLRHAAYCSLRHAAYCSLRHAAYSVLFSTEFYLFRILSSSDHRISPDITPLDFFLWWYVKDKEFLTPVPDITNF